MKYTNVHEAKILNNIVICDCVLLKYFTLEHGAIA